MANSFISEIIEDFISLFFPNYCMGCNDSLVKGEELVCSRCMLETPKTNSHLHADNELFIKFRGRIPADEVVAFLKFVKGSRVQQLLHSLKYRDQPALGQMLGKVYGHELFQVGYDQRFDLIIPVPLHRARLRRRGYNQSGEFARGLSEILKIPYLENGLRRIVATETQTRKTRLNRWKNVSDVFEVQMPEKIAGRRILLVDDVLTTGATLEAAARILRSSNCKTLGVACIAVAQ